MTQWTLNKKAKECGASGEGIPGKFREAVDGVESEGALLFLSSSLDDCLAATDLLVSDNRLLYP